MTETFYEVLGVEPDADRATVEAAFRERVKEVHPDVSDHPDAADRFKRVNRAEAVLTDPVERRRYDRLGHEAYLRLADLASVDADRDDAADDAEASPGHGAGSSGNARASGRGATGSAGARGAASAGAGGAADASGTTSTGGGGAADASGATAGGSRTADASGTATVGDSTTTDASGTTTAGDGATADAGGAEASDASATDTDGSPWQRARADDHWLSGPGPRRSPFVDRQEGVVLGVIMLVLHPVFLYSSVTPQFPLVVNAIVGLLTLAATMYVVATPYVGVAVFGILGLLFPVVLVAAGEGLASPLGVLGVVGVWVPFGFSLLMVRLVP